MQAETTFFNHASNVVVNGGSFSAVSKQLHTHLGSSALQNNYIPPGKIGKDDVLAILHNHSALAGLLDAKERFDAPKCDPSTRIGIIKKLTNWVESEGQSFPSSLLWLHGPAGVGKSALMQQLGLLMQEKGNHAASFFFSRTAVGRSDGNSLIVTLAYQLAMNFPPIRAHIASNLNKNPGIFSLSNKVKMQLLVVDPIDKLCATSFWKRFFRERFLRLRSTMQIPRLVIVDGLDECDNQDIQSDILLLVAHAISKLRLPLRFIIASRPEAHLLSSFNNSIFDKILYRLNLGADGDVKHDIFLFLAKEFKEIRLNHPLGRLLPDPWPTSAQISTLVMKSSGGFIYPATVLKYIRSPYLRPDECLKVILGLSSTPSSDCPYAQLDDLYSHIFNSAHEAHKTSVKLIFSVLAVPSTQQYSKTIISPALLNTYLSFSPGHVEQVLQNFLSLVDLRGEHDPIKLHHASLSDFLIDPKRSGEFCADFRLVHKSLADGCLPQLLSGSFPSHGSFVGSEELRFLYDMALNHCQRASETNMPLHEAYAPLDKVHCKVLSWTPYLSVYKNLPGIFLDAYSFKLDIIFGADSHLVPILFDEYRRTQPEWSICNARPPLSDFLMDYSRSGLKLEPLDKDEDTWNFIKG